MVQEYISTIPLQPVAIQAPKAGAEAITKITDSLLTEVQKSAISSAQQTGAEAGNNINFKPTTGGAAARAYNQAGLESNRYFIASHVAQKTTDLFSETSQIPDAEQAHLSFLAKFKGFSSGLLENIPAQNQAYARNILAHSQASAEMKLLSRVNKARQTQGYLAGMSSIDSYINQMSNAARNGDQPAALTFHADAQNNLGMLVNSGVIKPAGAEALQKKITDSLHENYYIGQYRLAKQEDEKNGTDKASKWLQGFNSSKQVGNVLSSTQQHKVNTEIARFNKEEAAAHGISEQNYSDRVNDIVFKATHTGQTPTSEELVYLKSIKPDKFDETQQQINNGLAIHSNVAVPQTIGDMGAQLAKLKTASPKDINQQKIQSGSTALLKTKMTQLQTDPVAISDTNTLYQKMNDNPVMQNAYKHDPNKIRLLWENKMGLRPDQWQVQTASQNQRDIAGIHALINGDDPKIGLDEAMNFLEQKQLKFPSTFHVYMQGITGKTGVPKYMETLVDMSQNPKSNVFLPDAFAAFSQKRADLLKVLPTGTGADVKSAISKNDNVMDFHGTFMNYQTQDTAESSAVLNNIEHFALWNMQKTPSMNATDAVKHSFNILYGNNYNYLGSDYKVRNTENPADVRVMLDYVDKNLKSFHLPSLPTSKGDLDFHFRDIFTLHNAYNNGHWINDSADDQNFVRVDVNGAPVRTPAGFDLFGKHIDRPVLSVTKDDLESPDFMAFKENETNKLLKQIKSPSISLGQLFAARKKISELKQLER